MRLIITRHGQTEENREGIIQGHLPGHLSPAGLEQAKKVALRLKDEPIDFILSSDLARAADTAREIARFHPDVPLEFSEAMRERFLGEWQGKRKKELRIDRSKGIEASLPRDAEPLDALYARASDLVTRVLTDHPHDSVLLVGHSGINKAIIAALAGKGAEGIHSVDHQRNTGVTVLEVNEQGHHEVLCCNCTKHLD